VRGTKFWAKTTNLGGRTSCGRHVTVRQDYILSWHTGCVDLSVVETSNGIIGQSHQLQEVLARVDDGDVSLGADNQKERSGEGRELPAGLTLPELEQLYILQTLARLRQNRTHTAAALGISLRCLQYKLKAYRRDSLKSGTPVG